MHDKKLMDYLPREGDSYVVCYVGYGFAAGAFKPLPFAGQNFGKIFNALQTYGGKFVFALLKILHENFVN